MSKMKRLLLTLLVLLVVVTLFTGCFWESPSDQDVETAVMNHVNEHKYNYRNVQSVEVIKVEDPSSIESFGNTVDVWPVRVYLVTPWGKNQDEFVIYENSFDEWEVYFWIF